MVEKLCMLGKADPDFQRLEADVRRLNFESATEILNEILQRKGALSVPPESGLQA
jgi:hypothetical protein